MRSRFVIEDDFHAEWMDQFDSRSDAVQELRRLAALSWNVDPNRAPCTNWANCSREYHLIEFDIDTEPFWTELSREHVLDVSPLGNKWINDFAA